MIRSLPKTHSARKRSPGKNRPSIPQRSLNQSSSIHEIFRAKLAVAASFQGGYSQLIDGNSAVFCVIFKGEIPRNPPPPAEMCFFQVGTTSTIRSYSAESNRSQANQVVRYLVIGMIRLKHGEKNKYMETYWFANFQKDSCMVYLTIFIYLAV